MRRVLGCSEGGHKGAMKGTWWWHKSWHEGAIRRAPAWAPGCHEAMRVTEGCAWGCKEEWDTGRAAGCYGGLTGAARRGLGCHGGGLRVWVQGGQCGATREGTRTLSEVPQCSGCWGVPEGPSLPWHLLDGATFVLAAGSPPARWEEGSGLRRKRAVLAVLLHFLETYKGLLQEEESAGKVIKVGVPFPCPSPVPPQSRP